MKLLKWIVNKWTEKDRLRAELAAALEAKARGDAVSKAADEALAKLKQNQKQLEGDVITLSTANQRVVSELRAAKRPRMVKVAERALKEGELLAALSVDGTVPIWRAVNQLLDDAITEAVDATAKRPDPDPKSGIVAVTPEVRTFHAGGIDHLRAFQETLLDWQERSLKADAGEEAEERE